MAVHIYGLPVDLDPILDLAEKYGLKVIEDAAEMIGQTYKVNPAEALEILAHLVFYSNKHITTGEGGMIVTNNKELAEDCKSLRNLCFTAENRFVHNRLGWNLRMTNLQAAVGLAQLERLDEFIKKKGVWVLCTPSYLMERLMHNFRYPKPVMQKIYSGFMELF